MDNLSNYSVEQLEAIIAQKKEDARLEADRLAQDEINKLSPFKKIIAILMKNDVTPYDFAFNDYQEIEELGKVKEVEQIGGEGEGDSWYSVKHFVDYGVFIRIDGNYSSYNGTDFYGELDSESMVYEVFPANIIKNVYVSYANVKSYEDSLKAFKDKVIAEYLAK